MRLKHLVSIFHEVSLAILTSVSYIGNTYCFSDLLEITLVNGQYAKRGTGVYCVGEQVNVQVNGYKKGANGGMVSCTVEKKDVLERGDTVKWNRGGGVQSGLDTCSDMVFDLTRDLTVQVMTAKPYTPFCPKTVELEVMKSNNGQISRRILCAKMESGYYKEEYNGGRNNTKIHKTTEGVCQ